MCQNKRSQTPKVHENVRFTLSELVGRPVVDQTGFAGRRFDFELRFAEEPGMVGLGLKAGPAEAQEAPDPSGPSLFSAIQSQLGLKLEATKGPVDFIVIERVEKPSPN